MTSLQDADEACCRLTVFSIFVGLTRVIKEITTQNKVLIFPDYPQRKWGREVRRSSSKSHSLNWWKQLFKANKGKCSADGYPLQIKVTLPILYLLVHLTSLSSLHLRPGPYKTKTQYWTEVGGEYIAKLNTTTTRMQAWNSRPSPPVKQRNKE